MIMIFCNQTVEFRVNCLLKDEAAVEEELSSPVSSNGSFQTGLKFLKSLASRPGLFGVVVSLH